MCSKVEFIFDKMLTYCNELGEVGSKLLHLPVGYSRFV